jgi:hypothetical protein
MSVFQRIKTYFADVPAGFVRKDLYHNISDIPPCAVFCCRSKSAIGYVIRRVTKSWTNHIAVYVGSGRQALIEALPDGMVETRVSSKFNNKEQFLVYINSTITVAQMQIIKSYLYGTLGKKYGWLEIVRFLGGIFKKIPTDTSRNFCSENAVEAYRQADVKLSQKMPKDTSPADVEEYLLSLEGRKAGWRLFDTYNT